MPARRSKTNQRCELLRTCNGQRTNGGGSRRRVCFSFGQRRKSERARTATDASCSFRLHSRTPRVSSPLKDGRPGTTIRAWTAATSADLLTTQLRVTGPGSLREPRATVFGRQPCVRCERRSLYCGDLTFDMSGGLKGAKRPLGCPLDGGVRCHCSREFEWQRAANARKNEWPGSYSCRLMRWRWSGPCRRQATTLSSGTSAPTLPDCASGEDRARCGSPRPAGRLRAQCTGARRATVPARAATRKIGRASCRERVCYAV